MANIRDLLIIATLCSSILDYASAATSSLIREQRRLKCRCDELGTMLTWIHHCLQLPLTLWETNLGKVEISNLQFSWFGCTCIIEDSLLISPSVHFFFCLIILRIYKIERCFSYTQKVCIILEFNWIILRYI